MDLFLLISALLLLMISASFSCSEIAFFSLSKEKVRLWAGSKNIHEKQVSSLVSKSRDLLVLIFFLNTFVNCLIQNLTSSIFGHGDEEIALKILLPFLFILIFGEYLPKYIGLLYSEQIARRMAPFFSFVKHLCQKPLEFLTHVAENLSSILFFFLRPEKPMDEKDLSDILQTSQSIGLLSQNEALVVEHAMELQKRTAQDEMIPLSEIPKTQITSLDDVKALFLSTQYHLIAIVQGSTEELLGIVDSSNLNLSKDARITNAKSLLTFIPETMLITRLIPYLRQLQAPYGAVYDEHGKVLGIISAKIIRNNFLRSLHTPELFNMHEKVSSEPFTFSGTTTLETINELFGSFLKSHHDQKTIGGWLTEILDTVPLAGTTLISHGLLFRILASDEKRVLRLFIQPVHTDLKEGRERT